MDSEICINCTQYSKYVSYGTPPVILPLRVNTNTERCKSKELIPIHRILLRITVYRSVHVMVHAVQNWFGHRAVFTMNFIRLFWGTHGSARLWERAHIKKKKTAKGATAAEECRPGPRRLFEIINRINCRPYVIVLTQNNNNNEHSHTSLDVLTRHIEYSV